MRKSIFISLLVVLIGGGIGIWLFFSTAILEFTDDMGILPKPIIEAPKTETGVVESSTGSTWNPEEMRTETLENSSGMSITVSTNGPPIRSMTPEEQAAFQRQIEGK